VIVHRNGYHFELSRRILPINYCELLVPDLSKDRAQLRPISDGVFGELPQVCTSEIRSKLLVGNVR
jgi:hypothetical protein